MCRWGCHEQCKPEAASQSGLAAKAATWRTYRPMRVEYTSAVTSFADHTFLRYARSHTYCARQQSSHRNHHRHHHNRHLYHCPVILLFGGTTAAAMEASATTCTGCRLFTGAETRTATAATVASSWLCNNSTCSSDFTEPSAANSRALTVCRCQERAKRQLGLQFVVGDHSLGLPHIVSPAFHGILATSWRPEAFEHWVADLGDTCGIQVTLAELEHRPSGGMGTRATSGSLNCEGVLILGHRQGCKLALGCDKVSLCYCDLWRGRNSVKTRRV